MSIERSVIMRTPLGRPPSGFCPRELSSVGEDGKRETTYSKIGIGLLIFLQVALDHECQQPCHELGIGSFVGPCIPSASKVRAPSGGVLLRWRGSRLCVWLEGS